MSVSISNPFSRVSVKLSNGSSLNLPTDQAQNAYPKGADTFKILPAVSATVSFGNIVDFVVNPADIDVLKKVYLALNVSQLTATGSSPTGVAFHNDARFLISHYDVILPDGSVAETTYPDSPYIRSLLVLTNEEKNRIYRGVANATLTTRGTLNGASGQTFYVPLWGFWNCGKGFVMKSLTGAIRIRVYLETLANVTVVASGTATASSATISSAFLYIQGKDYSSNPMAINSIVASNKKAGSVQQMFLTPVQMNRQVLNAGTNSYSVTLSSLIGNYAFLAFIVRTQAHVNTGYANAYDTYETCQSFALKTSNGALINGVTYPADFAQEMLTVGYFGGDVTDVAAGLGTTAPKAVYVIPFAEDPVAALKWGHQTGSFSFTGFEQLQINFASALGSNYVVDVIGWQYKYLETKADGSLKVWNA